MVATASAIAVPGPARATSENAQELRFVLTAEVVSQAGQTINGTLALDPNNPVQDARSLSIAAAFVLASWVGFGDPFIRYEIQVDNGSSNDVLVSLELDMDSMRFDQSFMSFSGLEVSVTDRNGDGATVALQAGLPSIHFDNAALGFCFGDSGDQHGSAPVQAAPNMTETTSFQSTRPFDSPAICGPGALGWNRMLASSFFSVSPGDSATINGFFEAVPEPGVFSMLIAAAAAGHRFRRRDQAR